MSKKAQEIRGILDDLKEEAIQRVKNELERLQCLLKNAKFDNVGFVDLKGFLPHDNANNIPSFVGYVHTDGQNIKIVYSESNAYHYVKIDTLSLDQVLGILERLELLEKVDQVKIL